jgi:acetoin utilization protein AcuB
MKAALAMTCDVVCIRPDDTLEDAYRIMTEWHIRHLPVVERSRLLGILSDRDVLIHATRREGTIHVPALSAVSAMTPWPLTCAASSSVSRVAGLMLEHKVDCIPITDEGGHLVGLVTSTDLIRLLKDKDDGEQHKVLPFRYRLRTESEMRASA